MRRHGRPETIVTDRLRSYGTALKELGRGDGREVGRWLNSRVENSHLPFRRRERAMLRFGWMRTLKKVASVHASDHNHFPTERHFQDRNAYKETRTAALAVSRGPLAARTEGGVGGTETGSPSSDSTGGTVIAQKLRQVRISLTPPRKGNLACRICTSS